MLLLKYNADVMVYNAEGRLAKDVTRNTEIKSFIEGQNQFFLIKICINIVKCFCGTKYGRGIISQVLCTLQGVTQNFLGKKEGSQPSES